MYVNGIYDGWDWMVHYMGCVGCLIILKLWRICLNIGQKKFVMKSLALQILSLRSLVDIVKIICI